MSLWNQDLTIKAWNFASQAHKDQFVPGSDIPYLNHIGNVVMETMTAIAQNNEINNPDLLIQCALLHDTIEDTNCTFDDIQTEFGLAVANGVLALSKNPQLATKQEKMADSLKRIKLQPAEVWMVKLADRITNLQPPPKHWNAEKIRAYHKEAKLILAELGSANEFLAQRLEQKISNYQNHL